MAAVSAVTAAAVTAAAATAADVEAVVAAEIEAAAALLGRVAAVPFDQSTHASFSFANKLAGENAWTASFTRQAIDAYHRFLVLSVLADHVVVPSKAVDVVWHKHLLYTHSYWQVLCAEVLKKPLHHSPSSSQADVARYAALYQQTLDSYARFFGEPAPALLWPPVAKRFLPQRLRTLDARQHIVVDKTLLLRWCAYALLCLSLLALCLLAVWLP